MFPQSKGILCRVLKRLHDFLQKFQLPKIITSSPSYSTLHLPRPCIGKTNLNLLVVSSFGNQCVNCESTFQCHRAYMGQTKKYVVSNCKL